MDPFEKDTMRLFLGALVVLLVCSGVAWSRVRAHMNASDRSAGARPYLEFKPAPSSPANVPARVIVGRATLASSHVDVPPRAPAPDPEVPEPR